MTLSLPPAVPSDAPLLVAYSGGADSRLLLSLAKEYGDACGLPVYAAHLHHGIRGEEAERDLIFCRRTAAELGVPLFEKRVDVPALTTVSGRSIEAEAREQRYLFFEEVMSQHCLPVLLTAHHADDLLETLLFRMLRGSGTRGMGGIPEIRPLAYGMAVRPLLSMTKADILEACRMRGLDFVTDSTNDDPFTLRNRLRRDIVPLLESMVGQGIPQQSAERLARAAREDDHCLSSLAAEALARCKVSGGISVDLLNQYHPAVLKRVLSLAYTEAATHAYKTPPDSRHTLSFAHLEALAALCEKAVSGTSLDLPLMTADLRKGLLCFLPHHTESPRPRPPVALHPGDTPWDNGRMIIRLEICTPAMPLSAEDVSPEVASLEEVIASAVFPSEVLPLTARVKAEGDTILSHGMHKKLKKLLCDKGVPPHLRERIPLICHGDPPIPLWYPTVAFKDGFPPPCEGTAIRISLIRTKY